MYEAKNLQRISVALAGVGLLVPKSAWAWDNAGAAAAVPVVLALLVLVPTVGVIIGWMMVHAMSTDKHRD